MMLTHAYRELIRSHEITYHVIGSNIKMADPEVLPYSVCRYRNPSPAESCINQGDSLVYFDHLDKFLEVIFELVG